MSATSLPVRRSAVARGCHIGLARPTMSDACRLRADACSADGSGRCVGQNRPVSATGAGDGGIRNGDAVALWLMRAEGSAALGRCSAATGCPTRSMPSCTVAVIHAAELMDARGEAIDNVAAWTQRTLRLRALDLLKSPGSRRAVAAARPTRHRSRGGHRRERRSVGRTGVADGGRRPAPQPGRPVGRRPSVAGVGIADVPVDHLRRRGGRRELPAAHQRGHRARNAALWASLYYAGERDLFPTGPGSDSAAQRQQRKRRMTHVSSLVGEAYLASQGRAVPDPLLGRVALGAGAGRRRRPDAAPGRHDRRARRLARDRCRWGGGRARRRRHRRRQRRGRADRRGR